MDGQLDDGATEDGNPLEPAAGARFKEESAGASSIRVHGEFAPVNFSVVNLQRMHGALQAACHPRAHNKCSMHYPSAQRDAAVDHVPANPG